MDESPPALCPRCGYDQSGIVATWTEACPLEGICSECGYAFAWRQIYDPAEKALPGFIEHCRRRWIVPCAFRTLLWTIVPWWFWSKVKMHHRIVPRRWLAWLAVTVLGLYAVNVLSSGALLYAWERQEHQRQQRSFFLMHGQQLHQADPELGVHHFLAAAVHGPFMLEDDRFVAFGYARFRTTYSARVRLMFTWSGLDSMPIVQMFLVGISTWITGFLLLFTDTRAKVKIRKSHVVRAYVFSLAVIPAFGVVRLLESAEFWFRCLWHGQDLDRMALRDLADSPQGVMVATGWMLVWWWSALGRGFRLPGAWYHVLILGVAAVLGSVVCLYGLFHLGEAIFPGADEASFGSFWETYAY